MTNISNEHIDGINLALNEATLLGVEFSKEQETIAVTFAPVALDENGQVPTYNRVQFIFTPIGKFIASLRLGHWDDTKAEIVKFEPEQILEKVEEFGHLSIYGWEFMNCKEDVTWLDKLSCEFTSKNSQGLQNNIELFQEGFQKHIDIKFWFDEFEIFTPTHEKIELQTFIDNGKRGWDGIYYGNASDKFGIYPGVTNNINIEEKRQAVNNTGAIYTTTKKSSIFKKILNKIWRT